MKTDYTPGEVVEDLTGKQFYKVFEQVGCKGCVFYRYPNICSAKRQIIFGRCLVCGHSVNNPSRIFKRANWLI